MNHNEAKKFLENNQPMPNDELITEEVIDKYDEIRLFLMDNPKECFIELFLKSYGCGDGLGTYVLVEDFYQLFDDAVVVRYINKILRENHLSECTKYWIAQVALLYPYDELDESMKELENSKNPDIVELVKMFLSLKANK